MQYIDKKDIKGQNLLTKTVDYFVKKFRQSSKIFSYSTGTGQIILVTQNLSKIIFYYIKDSINEVSFHTARRRDSIAGLAQLNGHNVHRGTGANGSISVALKSGLNNTADLTDQILIPNYMKVKCKQNGLMYYVLTGEDIKKIDVKSGKNTSLALFQGVMKVSEFIGDGADIQTYSVVLDNKQIDMNNITLLVNGEKALIHNSVEEFEYEKLNAMIRTGLTSGIDIIFGKEITSKIPQAGNNISITYPVVDGVNGNIDYPLFEFVGNGYKTTGESINMNEFFEMKPENRMMFGSDGEDIETTRLLAPSVNKNRIISDKKSTKYHFDTMNIFGAVKVFNNEQPNVMETYLFPKLENIIGDGEDYFNMDREKIFIDEETNFRLLEKVNKIRSQNIDIVINNPVIKNYAMLIRADAFRSDNTGADVNLNILTAAIRDTISDYMLQLKRTNKIPKSDITKIVDDVANIDSVDVEFVVEEADMIDDLGNIVTGDKEIALPAEEFIDQNGDVVKFAIKIDVVYI